MPDKPNQAVPLAAGRSPWLRGAVRVPGDRSASRLVLILAALARGESTIEHLSGGPDIAALIAALRQLGATITQRAGKWLVRGTGASGFLSPDGVIELGALGDGALLLIALLGVHDFETKLSGYAPTAMSEALLDFLNRTGSRIERKDATIALRGPRFALPLDLRLPTEAMALKVPLLLASLVITGTSYLRLPGEGDFADGLVSSFGASLTAAPDEAGTRVSIEGAAPLKGQQFTVPGDPIFAAFPAVAALIAPDSEISIDSLSISMQRMAVLDALKLMGADIAMTPPKDGGRDTADLVARHSKLSGTLIPADLEIEAEDFAILAAAAAFAEGETLFEGLGEGIRRLNLTRALRANGVECEERQVGLAITGAPRVRGGGNVVTRLDPKLAMAFLVLGLGADKPISIDDGAAMSEFYPEFVAAFEHIGGRFIAGKAN
jgi:3-phosphoshikimate 1-carboxyvinyltransferase